MQIPLDRASAQPMYRQIVDFVDQQIRAGNLQPGYLLPSIRSLAQRLGVSKTIVALAYAELESDGRVTGHVGHGTVVMDTNVTHRAPAPLPLPTEPSPAAAFYDLLRMAGRTDVINFTITAPSPEHMPMDEFGRCLRAVLQQDGPAAYAYHMSDGYPPLRQAIARHLMHRGIIATPDEVLVTSGAQQAIDLIIRTLVRPGEWIVAESPCFMGALEAFAGHGVRVAPVPLDEGGLMVDHLETLFRRVRPRLLYTIPTFQNPTGTTLSLERRRRLVELAARWDVTILEDAVCYELELTAPAPPALHALGGPVVHCGSFSKALLPGIRIGYVVAKPDIIRRLALAKQAADIGSPGLIQRALARFLDAGLVAPHLRVVLDVYRRRRTATLEALRRHMPPGVTWTEPTGGLHLWLTVPPEVDVSRLLLDALDAGVAFAPGAMFYPGGTPTNHLRICYGALSPLRIEAGIARLADLIARAPRAVTATPAAV